MRPSKADTSEPAWVKRKMLSMKRSTSCPSSSRKYSATVRPDRPTRRRAGWLVHLPVHEGGLVDDAGLAHLEVEVIAFAGPLAHAGEDRESALMGRDVVDQLHDDDGLAHAGAAEEAHLPALGVRLEQVHDLDAGLQHLGLCLLFQ